MMIGIIPAAGRAERMGRIPKFILPIPGGILLDVLRERMRKVDTKDSQQEGIIVVGNTDNHKMITTSDPHDHLIVLNTETMCESVLSAQRFFIRSPNILFGMPDTYFEDDQAFVRLAAAFVPGADVAVGVFLTRPEQRSKLGMVRTNGDRVEQIIDKPAETDLTWAWGVLAWKPVFWQYIHADDAHLGLALNRAIEARLAVRAVQMEGGYWDCGTPDEYFALIRYLTEVRDAV